MERGFACVRKLKERKDMRKREAEPKSAGTLCLHRLRLVMQSGIELCIAEKMTEKSKGGWNEHVGVTSRTRRAFV